MKILFYTIQCVGYAASLLPLCILYRFSDVLYYLLYYGIRYRKNMVKTNLRKSFPEKSAKELTRIEKEFYAFLCDYMVETIKLFSISERQLKRRMQFEGVEEMVQALEKENKQFGFIYLGHYGNWEWVSSLTARVHDVNPKIIGGQIYHPLSNKVFDRIFKKVRGKSGGENIPMKDTLRRIVYWKRNGKKAIIGFISDQTPKWNCIHHWTDFFHRKTPVFTGTERIGKQVDALIFYADMERIKRGYYRCRITRMTDDIQQHPDYELTDWYIHRLEQTIKKAPAFWLWSHNRWKRTLEELESRRIKSAG